MMKKLLFMSTLWCWLFLLPLAGWSQYVINGNASNLGNNCYQLTPAAYYQGGSVWFQNKVTLSSNIRVEGTVNLGSSNGGADGIAFVLQPVCSGLGSVGGGLGYMGITPSLAVEFDTWYNSDLSDPVDDHVALMKNGMVIHSSSGNLQGPFVLPNLEDGLDHPVVIEWNAASANIKVWLDGILKIDYTDDIITNIFSGNANVFWGFTAATGAAINNQSVCITSVDFVEEGSFTITKPSCPDFNNGAIDLSPAGGVQPISYSWSTGAVSEDISGLTAGNYSVTVTDGNGCQTVYSIDVTDVVDGAPVISCPENITVNNDPGQCGAKVYYNVTSTDECTITSLPGFTYIGSMGGSSYFVSNDQFTWLGALAHSQANGLHMAAITSAAENDFVVNGLVANGLAGTNPWIGLSDADVEGVWKWITGEPYSYSNWQPGEPNNAAGGTENYANYYNIGGTIKWNDLPNSLPGWTPNPYILELEGTPVFLQAGLYSGDVFPKGTTTVTYQAIDATGNTSQCSFTVTVVDADNSCGCTLTQGYWKTHSEFGPAPYNATWAQLPNGASTPYFLSGMTYYQVLWTSPNGNAYYILAHQYIAAQLNSLNGAYFVAAQASFNSATALFNVYTPVQVGAMKANNPVRQQFLALATTLDNYNNGITGPGHCEGDQYKASIADPVSNDIEAGIKIYPNPVSYTGTIEFTAPENARTTIELYSLTGLKMGLLYDEISIEGIKYRVEFSVQSYPSGNYIVVMRNGSSMQKVKLSISNR